MKLGKIELTKKKLIIGGSVVLAAALISAGVIFACNANKTAEVKPEEAAVIQEATTEENKDQNQDQNQAEAQNNEVKNDNAKNKDKKENKTAKDNNKKIDMPEIKTDLKVNGDQVVLNAEGKDGSSKTILTFNGDKLSKLVVEMNCSDEKILKESKEFYEKSGFKIVESNAKNLKAEMGNELIEYMNQLFTKKQDVIDFYKQFSEAMKG